MQPFYEVTSVTVNSCILLSTKEEAQSYPRGDIVLAFCRACGFISNIAFDARLTEYSSRYEETQGYSATFNAFNRALAERLISDYSLCDKEIIEIGCGKGEFLALLCGLGNNRGVGFDPGFHEDRFDPDAIRNIRFIADFYSPEYSHYGGDFYCCKMTLEHIPAAYDFVAMVSRSITRKDALIFFQVPEAMRILRECAFEDIYYEHCSYFSAGSLARLFRRCGFEPLVLRTEYDGQYLTIEARPRKGAAILPEEDDLDLLAREVASFEARCKKKRDTWRGRLEQARERNVVLWGSGSKAVSFLTTFKPEGIEFVVDINPHRQNCFMPLTGQKIVSPDFLSEYKPDVVIAMNPIYLEEIGRDLAVRGLAPELVAL
jgi:hypothetical protein